MVPARGHRSGAALLALFSALSWGGFYVLVLWLAPIASPGAVLFYPFLVSGLLFLAVMLASGAGGEFLRIGREPGAYLRILLSVVMLIATLAATYAAGPIDTSLLALFGDVVMVPLLLMLLYREDRHHARSPWFLAGIAICLAGGAATISGGTALQALSGWQLLLIPTIPIVTGFYFLLMARAARQRSLFSLNAHAMLGSGIVVALLSPWLPGGPSGLLPGGFTAVLLLVSLGALTFFLAPYLYFAAIELGGVLLAAILMSLIPAFTVVLGITFLGIQPSWFAAVGIPVAILGAFLALRGPRAADRMKVAGDPAP